MTTNDTQNLPDPGDWPALQLVWMDFIKKYPQTRMSDSRFACSRFISVHAAKLIELGVLRRAGRGGYIAHKKKFGHAAFAVMHDLIPTHEAVST